MSDYHTRRLPPEDDTSLPCDTITLASWDAVETIDAGGSYQAFVWPNDHAEAEPLLVDIQTARLLMLVHDALHPDNRLKCEELVARSRVMFGRLVDMAWGSVAR